MKFKLVYQSLLVILFVASSCKKDNTAPAAPVVPNTPTPPSRADLSRDSIFLYAKEIYLWNNLLPSYEVFKPRQYTSASTDLANYENVLFQLTTYALNPTTSKSFEYLDGRRPKFSYISDKTTENPTAYIHSGISAVDLEGNGNDLGIKLGAYLTNSTTRAFALFVTAVYQNSPADKAGIVRSDRIRKINGQTIGANFENEVSSINSAFAANTIELEGTKYANGVETTTSFKITLNKASYKSDPIYAKKVLTAGSKKIGYLAYARFSNMANSQASLDAAFNEFATAGVSELIVDLRYNGGGYVNTAQYLINLIAPANLDGQVMFAEHFNSTLQNGQAKILANQPLLDANNKVQFQNGRIVTYADVNYSVAANTERFSKKGNLQNISNVVFIVSDRTASSSELVINSLKPYINVKIVGEKTYGKPIGFFPIVIENRYKVYFSLFQTKNSTGQGDYYDGFLPDVADDFDDPTRNFGDIGENYLAKALNLLAPGITVTGNSARVMSLQQLKVSTPTFVKEIPLVDGNEFVGMIDNTFKIR